MEKLQNEKKVSQLDLELDTYTTQLDEANAKLEESAKIAGDAELEIAALQRRVALTEDDLKRQIERLTQTTAKLEIGSKRADQSEAYV
jgi:predicted  nucleic acid-binding Zn-ribbon protein